MEPALHLSLNVSNVTRARDFYAAFFGISPAKEKPGYVKFVTSEPTIHLALNETGRRPDPKGSLSHLGLRVGTSGEVDAWKARLTARGVSGFDEKDTTCCYARQDKFWVSDPDGNKWEVYTVLEDVEVAKDPTSTCCAPGDTTAGAASCCA
ncbi:MAG: ArsI/CadI family heavy metal resistance metalloenzyme [Acidobacteriota bacterium]